MVSAGIGLSRHDILRCRKAAHLSVDRAGQSMSKGLALLWQILDFAVLYRIPESIFLKRVIVIGTIP
ncbi:hypothetical protein ACVWZ4_007364 [Bradyrhizobium sp. USDA 4472]